MPQSQRYQWPRLSFNSRNNASSALATEIPASGWLLIHFVFLFVSFCWIFHHLWHWWLLCVWMLWQLDGYCWRECSIKRISSSTTTNISPGSCSSRAASGRPSLFRCQVAVSVFCLISINFRKGIMKIESIQTVIATRCFCGGAVQDCWRIQCWSCCWGCQCALHV